MYLLNDDLRMQYYHKCNSCFVVTGGALIYLLHYIGIEINFLIGAMFVKLGVD